MRSRPIQLLFLLSFLVAPLLLPGQERAQPTISDHVWTSISLTGRPPKFFNGIIGKEARKRIRLNGEIGYRSADAFFAGRQIYFDGGIRYKVSDLLSIGMEQRYAYRPDREDRTRTLFQVYLSKTYGRFDLNYRFRYQHNYREFGSQRELFRHRFGAEYNIPNWKLDPFVSTELFTWADPEGLSYIGTRHRLGTQLNLGNAHSIIFAILHDRERGIAWPHHRWIYSIDYGFNLTKARQAREKKEKKNKPAKTGE